MTIFERARVALAGPSIVDHKRFVFLDGLRGLASIIVVIHHFTQYTTYPIMDLRGLNVNLFFCLSGFVLTKAYSRRIQGNLTLIQFVKLRLIRLYPLYLVGLLLGLVAVWIKMAAGTSDYTDYTWRDLTEGFVLNLALLPFPNHGAMPFPFNIPNWSLFFELAANLSVFAFIKMGLHSIKGTIWVVLLSFLCFGFAMLVGRADSGWGPGILHFGIGLVRTTFFFYSGVLMAAVHSRLNVRFNMNSAFATAIVAGFILFCLRCPSNAQYFVAVLLIPIGVYCGSYVRTNELGKSVCLHLGDLSYPLYCVHFPIVMLVDAAGFYVSRHDHWIAESISGCALSIVTAWALAKYFDAPVRQRLMLRHRNQLASATDRDGGLGFASSPLATVRS